MKVLHVISPSLDDGVEIVGACWSAIMLCNEMANSTEVEVGLATKLSGYSMIDDRINIHEIEVKKSRINKDIITEALKVYSEYNYDVMHVHVHSLSVIKWMQVLVPDEVNVVYTLHTPTMLGRSSLEYGPYGKLISNKSNFLISAPSNHMQNIWKEFIGEKDMEIRNLVTVYNGTNYDKLPILKPHDREGYVVVCCRVDPMKRVLETLRELNRHNIKTIFIGDFWTTSKSNWYSDEVRSILDSSDCIEWKPRLSNKEVKDVMRRAKCLVTLSDQESFGLTTAEAISVGTPVIYSTGGAVEEVMENGVTGLKLLFPYRSAWTTRGKILATAVNKILSGEKVFDPDKLVSFYESHYTIKRMSDNYIIQYHRLINKEVI